jgi:hypothetical protein
VAASAGGAEIAASQQFPVRGQGRDCSGLSGEDRIEIRRLPWRARYREKTGTAAPDPKQMNTCAAGGQGLAIRLFVDEAALAR